MSLPERVKTQELQKRVIWQELTHRSLTDFIAKVCVKHLTPDRVIKTAYSVILDSPKLIEVAQTKRGMTSLLRCISLSAQLGLEPGPVLDQCAYVPFKDVVQFIPMYKGKLDLAYRSEQVKAVCANAVYEKDHFVYQYGIEEKLEHRPCEDPDRGDVRGAYCLFRMKDGRVVWHFCPRTEVEAHRARSVRGQAKDSPWTTDYAAMAIKTAIHVTSKYVKLSPEFHFADRLEMLAETGEDQGKFADNGFPLPPTIGEGAVPEDAQAEEDPRSEDEKNRAARAVVENLRTEKPAEGGNLPQGTPPSKEDLQPQGRPPSQPSIEEPLDPGSVEKRLQGLVTQKCKAEPDRDTAVAMWKAWPTFFRQTLENQPDTEDRNALKICEAMIKQFDRVWATFEGWYEAGKPGTQLNTKPEPNEPPQNQGQPEQQSGMTDEDKTLALKCSKLGKARFVKWLEDVLEDIPSWSQPFKDEISRQCVKKLKATLPAAMGEIEEMRAKKDQKDPADTRPPGRPVPEEEQESSPGQEPDEGDEEEPEKAPDWCPKNMNSADPRKKTEAPTPEQCKDCDQYPCVAWEPYLGDDPEKS